MTSAEPMRLRLGASNVYALRGPAGVTLIDAGPDYDGAWDDLIDQLARRGITPRDVRAVVLTHHHGDHAGLAARWQATGAVLCAGQGDEPYLAMDSPARLEARERVVAALIEHGAPEAVARTALERAGRGGGNSDGFGGWPGPLRMTPVIPDRLLRDGDSVDGGALDGRVIACPGHTPGAIVVCDRRGGALYTGDHLLPRKVATAGIQFGADGRLRSLPRFYRSLRRLDDPAYEGVWAYPGHGAIIADVRAEARWSRRHIERRARRLHGRLAAGPSTAFDLSLAIFPRLQPEHTLAVLAETMGLLDLLVDNGYARPAPGGVIARYVTAERRFAYDDPLD
ncbi:MAG: MBL fold metallo-hydrolase [Dehalococcoidia bacterium]